MKKKGNYPLIVIILLAISCTGLGATPSLKDDAFHYLHNEIDDQLYNEWWYFNGIWDREQFFVSYAISDPENKTGFRMIRAKAAILEDGKPPITGYHDSRGFGADRSSPNLDIDNSGFSALNESAYHIWGSVEEPTTSTPLQWDLTYRANMPAWFAMPVPNQVGHLRNDWMKWLVYMPSAEVSGTLSWNNQSRNVSAVGYHDHNWGRWAFNDPQWNWAEVSIPEDSFSLALGEVLGAKRNAVLGMSYQGELIEFKNRELNISCQDFALDPLTARSCPTAYKVKADNRDWKLDMNISVEKNLPLVVSYPWPQVSYVFFEQVSNFQGTLNSRKGAEYQFDEKGFSKYTTHLLHPLTGRVNSSNPATVTINADNQRTGQTKIAEPSSMGWFSFDADYEDYLINSTAPWVNNGDTVIVTASDGSGKEVKAEIAIDLGKSSQEMGVIELS
jgi:hypothetical protein